MLNVRRESQTLRDMITWQELKDAGVPFLRHQDRYKHGIPEEDGFYGLTGALFKDDQIVFLLRRQEDRWLLIGDFPVELANKAIYARTDTRGDLRVHGGRSSRYPENVLRNGKIEFYEIRSLRALNWIIGMLRVNSHFDQEGKDENENMTYMKRVFGK